MTILEWLGLSGVTPTGVASYVGQKSYRRRLALRKSPLEIHRQVDLTEPGPIWTLVSPRVLERENFIPLIGEKNRGSSTPNQFRRDAQACWGMYDADRTVLAIRLMNKRQIPLYVTCISAVIVEEDEIPHGTLITNPPQGDITIRNLQISLDGADQRAKSPSGEDYFSGHVLEIDPGKAEFLNVSAVAQGGAYTWRLQFSVMVDGTTTTQQLFPPAGEPPLRTAGRLREGRYEREWVCCSPLVLTVEDAQASPYLHSQLMDYV